MENVTLKAIGSTVGLTKEMWESYRTDTEPVIACLHGDESEMLTSIANLDTSILEDGDSMIFENFLLLKREGLIRVFHQSDTQVVREVFNVDTQR